MDTAALQVSPGNETHLHAFGTQIIGNDGRRATLYLHTSPEFACKKLLAAGERRLFTFAHVFRNAERTALHHPEFTMLEWYRADEEYDAVMDDCAALVAAAARATGATCLAFRGRIADPFAPAERLSVREAFGRHLGLDLAESLGRDARTPDRDVLAGQLVAQGLRVAPDDTWSDLFSRALGERIEPHLGIGRATFLYEYPACEAALARRTPRDARFSERFELYACGVELANGFGELTDAAEQRARFQADMDEKERIYGDRYPVDEDFLSALAFMPPASGVALGFDRLVMLLSGASRIEQVVWTPVVEAP